MIRENDGFPKVFLKFHSRKVKMYTLKAQEPLYSRKMYELLLERMLRVFNEFVFFTLVVLWFMKVLA